MAMPTSWCDKLASVPTVGFRLDPHYASSDAILDSLTPMLNPLFQDEKARFSVGHQTSFEVRIETEEGFQYAVDPIKTTVAFRHRMRAKNVSGGPPTMEMLSKPLPFTVLLPEVFKRLVNMTLVAPGSKNREIVRVGVISTTAVGEDQMPPGIARFIEYIGRPWNGSAKQYDIQILSNLQSASGFQDRCIHAVKKTEDPDQLIAVTLDWQRLFDVGHPIDQAKLEDIAAKAERSALAYFEDVAEGKRFDEKLISEAAGAAGV
jgi:hypothetical protein